MEHTLHLKLDFNLTLGGGVSIDHRHHHSSNPSQPGAADILNSIQDLKGTFMTQLQDALAELKADDAQLESEIDEVLGKLAQVPGEIAAAVQQALVNAGLDDTTIRQTVIDIDSGVKAAIAKVTAVLTPPVDPGTGGGDTTSGGDTTTNTLVGGQGDDTLGGGNGSDTVGAGGGTDTSVGGQGSDTISASDGAVSDPASEGAATADNQSHVEADPGQPASGGATPPASDAV